MAGPRSSTALAQGEGVRGAASSTASPSIQLADEFPGCVILALADDVHIIAPPELAAAAYERWRFLYAALLQGELNDSKSKCYSPKIPTEALQAAGMPTDV